MKDFPYDLNSLKNYNEIKNNNLNFFCLKKRRITWDYVVSELIKIKFQKKSAEEFFTTISSQLYVQFPPILCALIEYHNYKKKDIKLKFNDEITNKILNSDLDEESFFNFFSKSYTYSYVNKFKVFLRNIYFFGNLNKKKIDLIDHNYNSRKFCKKNFNVRYKPSNNFFDFKKIITKIDDKSQEHTEIFEQNFKYLDKIFSDYLKNNLINEKILNNFSFFLKCFLKFEINIFLQSKNILTKSNVRKDISSSISGFKSSRLITSYNYFREGNIYRFDDQNGGLLHGNHKAAYLNNLANCTDYYFSTTNGKNIAEKFYKDFFKKNEIDKKINFHSLNYENKFNSIKKNKIYKKIKYVYFSISFRHIFHGSGSFHDIDYLNLQNIIFNFLKSNTNELLYRAHPETIIGVKKNPLEKYLNNLSFEETIKNGNVCIFDTTVSSAFWQCIQNQNPVILIRHYHVDEKSSYFERLEKRCEIIDIEDPELTENVLKNINFNKISSNSIEKSQVCFDNFDNIVV
jgi:hypothetical protein